MVRVGSAPRVPVGARSLGAVSSSASLSGTVVLKPRDNAALSQFIDQVSDPTSPMFHQYLPAGAFAGPVRPDRGTIDAVRAPAPQDGAGPADVIVTLNGGKSSAPGPSSTFEYVDTSAGSVVPSITAVIPFGGSESAPSTATILGSGFSGATAVTFGGVPARSFTVDSPNQITVTPPRFSGRTACSPLPSTDVYRGENASNDICQVQVRVTSAYGTSATGHILPPLEGPIEVNNLGVLVAPTRCGCETQLASTEFDYLPAPRVSSVSTSAGPASWLNEDGTSVLTAHGVGFAPMDIDWADFGDPALASSMDVDYVYVTGTEMQIVAPPQSTTSNPLVAPFSVKTLAGQSNAVPVTYAPTPPS